MGTGRGHRGSEGSGQAHPYHHGDLRNALVAAAEAELAEHGIEGFTLRGCAKRAGVSHAAPAHHFGDAAGLLTAVAAAGFERFLTFQRQRQEAASPDPSSQLVAAGFDRGSLPRTAPTPRTRCTKAAAEDVRSVGSEKSARLEANMSLKSSGLAVAKSI